MMTAWFCLRSPSILTASPDDIPPVDPRALMAAWFCLRSPSILTASPDDIPPVDPRALMEVEVHARKTAASLDYMLGTLQNNLHKVSTCALHQAYYHHAMARR